MSLVDRLAALIAALPPGGSVTLPRESLEEWLAEAGVGDDGADLDVATVALRLRKSQNTVRRYLERGELRGYQPGGRGWRVTPAALAEFRAVQHAPAPTRTADLGAWRDVYGRG